MLNIRPIKSSYATTGPVAFIITLPPSSTYSGNIENGAIYRYNGSVLKKDSSYLPVPGWYSVSGIGSTAYAFIYNGIYVDNSPVPSYIKTYDGSSVGTLSVDVGGKVYLTAYNGAQIMAVAQNSNTSTATSFRFDGTTKTANSATAPRSTSTAGIGANLSTQTTYLFGGVNDSSSSSVNSHSSIQSLWSSGSTFVEVASLSNPMLASSVANLSNTVLKIFGGYSFSGSSSTYNLYNTIQSWDGSTRSTDSSTIASASYAHCATNVGSNIFIFGGNNTTTVGNTPFTTIQRYNGSTRTTDSTALPRPCSGRSAVTIQQPTTAI